MGETGKRKQNINTKTPKRPQYLTYAHFQELGMANDFY